MGRRAANVGGAEYTGKPGLRPKITLPRLPRVGFSPKKNAPRRDGERHSKDYGKVPYFFCGTFSF